MAEPCLLWAHWWLRLPLPAGCSDCFACCWCTGQSLKGLFAVSTPPHPCSHVLTIERHAAVSMASQVALTDTAYLSVVKFCHGYSILKNRAYSLCSQLRGLVEGTTDVLECRVTSLLPQGRNHFRVVFVLFHTAAGCIRATLEGFLPSHGGWVKVGLQGNAEMGHRVLVHTLKVLELAPACIWLSGLGGWQEKYHPPVLLFLKNFLKIPAPPTHVLKISQ